MKNPIETPPQPTEVLDTALLNIRLFNNVSGASESTADELQKLAEDAPELGENDFDNARKICHYLRELGYQYDDSVFRAQEIVADRKGNCLGLSLLIGSILQYKTGRSPSYEVITHPLDAVDRHEQKYFNELVEGREFSYDRPFLPHSEDRAEKPLFRFAPLEHPVFVFGDERFEVTSLEDEDPEFGWTPKSERQVSATYEQLSGSVLIDRAKLEIQKGTHDAEAVHQLIASGLEQWPENRDGWFEVWEVARAAGNKEQERYAMEQYDKFGGTDSRHWYNKFLMTGDSDFLDKCLAQYPAHIEAFTHKNVLRESDSREAKFNLAVAAWCYANSASLDLKLFYEKNRMKIEELYGEDVYSELF